MLPDAPIGERLPEWYRQRRKAVEAVFQQSAVPPHQPADFSSASPSRTYLLEVTTIGTGPKTWDYSRGTISRVDDRKVIADIQRNFGHFPFAWALQGGKEYLICGEDYQGHSVVDLGEEVTYVFVHDGAEKGLGFCWRKIRPSPNGMRLLVEGCYWASDYEWRVYDFTTPTRGPSPVIAYLSFLHGNPYDEASGPQDARWLDDDRIQLDGKDLLDLQVEGLTLAGPELAKRYPNLKRLFAEP